ncbi:MAG: metallophosphoesterase family protein [Persicimonas sp.]
MPHPIFRWIDCTDRTRPRTLLRPSDVKLRLAQITDPHVPGEVSLMRRLRDLMGAHESVSDFSHQIGAISNELGHRYRKRRRLYTNLIKKALLGLHQVGVDHLMITGDLSHCSLPTEFLEIRGALEVTGWWGDDKLTVIPGNHDRFNLYERVPKEPMEAFFDVVTPRKPRIKKLDGGVALLEVDTNRDRLHDRHPTEKWLPNTVGKIYREVPDWFDKNRADIEGMRVVGMLHHHITDDWYNGSAGIGGLMAPADGVDDLVGALDLVDEQALLLHGHKHDVMPVEYDYNGHPVSCPGGFASQLRLNLIDFTVNDEAVMTQVELRT